MLTLVRSEVSALQCVQIECQSSVHPLLMYVAQSLELIIFSSLTFLCSLSHTYRYDLKIASIFYVHVLQGIACWLQFHNGLNCWRAGRSVCKDGPYEGVWSPEWVGDAFAASQIEDFKPKIAEAVIGLKECGM